MIWSDSEKICGRKINFEVYNEIIHIGCFLSYFINSNYMRFSEIYYMTELSCINYFEIDNFCGKWL